MAQDADNVSCELAVHFEGNDVDLDFEDGDTQMKPILFAIALITFISLLIMVIVQSKQIAAMNEEFKEISATGEWLFFFAKEPQLKGPFQERLEEAFNDVNGTGIRMKHNGKCLGVDEKHLVD